MRAFLARSPPESAIWEAKGQGTKGQLAEFVRKEVCGLANRRGGYLVLGAQEEPDGTWTSPGVEVKGVREMHDWIASLLRDLQPAPVFDVHEWHVGRASKLVVVQVEAAALPPVSYNGVVYLRHGTQNLRADGPAIRRLAAQGERAETTLSRAARKEAEACIHQLWTSFGLAIARPGDRLYALDDPRPEQALYRELERALAVRFRARSRQRMEWGSASLASYKDLGLKERPPTFRGWRAAWMTEQTKKATRIPLRLSRRMPRDRPKIDLSLTDRDIWAAFLLPTNAASAFVFHMPVRRHAIESEHGDRVIGNAALILRALLKVEAELGAKEHEPVFIALALREWGVGAPVLIERQATMAVSSVEWRRDVTLDAARKMRLT